MAKKRWEYIEEHDEDESGEITFKMYDKATVKRLQKNGDINLPEKYINRTKDKKWNAKKLSSRLTQGILNGDSLDKIAESLVGVSGINEASSMRNARTMLTAAESQGRQDSYEELAERGVIQKKIWIATPDGHTRESHLELDGEEVDIDEEFSNGCRFPGDPECDDEGETWSCRCTMRDRIVGFRRSDGSISYLQHSTGTTENHKEAIEREHEKREKEQERRKKENG